MRLRVAWVCGLALGCDGGGEPPADASVVNDLGAPRSSCDDGAHVDCFGGPLTCVAGVVRVPLYSPIPFCTNEEASAAYQRGICEENAGSVPCQSAQCAPPDRRFARCLSDFRGPVDRLGPFLRTLCRDGLATAGSPCADGRGCTPAVALAAHQLLCDEDAGRCALAPRGSPGRGHGVPCTDDGQCAPGLACVFDTSCRGACVPYFDAGAPGDA